jgi:hypothetical protein
MINIYILLFLEIFRCFAPDIINLSMDDSLIAFNIKRKDYCQ